ncbi:hypothetical protein TYRP_000086 [Tyrophagus putrescentiae]|nr:hypothetical protein TYRP_000086 [Tyrophagus putrescentiae]
MGSVFESEYMIALLSKPTGHLTPVCLVLDGPLVHCAPPEPVLGADTENSAGGGVSGEIVKAYRVVRTLAIHQRAVFYLVDSAHQSLLSLIGAGSVALLCNYTFGPAYRTALRCTSILIGGQVRLIAERNQVGNSALSGHHHMDVDGEVKVVLDGAGQHCSLYLLQGTLFLDGRAACHTAEQALVEGIYGRERQLRTQSPLSPAVIPRNQLLTTLNVPKEQVGGGGGGGGQRSGEVVMPTEQQSHQTTIKSHAQVVQQSLKARFVFSSFIPVNTGEQQGKVVLVGKVDTNFNAGRPLPPSPVAKAAVKQQQKQVVASKKVVASKSVRTSKSFKGKVIKSILSKRRGSKKM